jgi:hypothetical protein
MLSKFLSRYNMKIITISAILIWTCICAHSQNLIGYKEKEIRKYMKENRSDMNYNTVINSKFNYLKYSDNLENQTVLFFLTPDSVCRSVRIICDMSLKPQKVNELNALFLKNGENKWIDKQKGKDYLVEMKDGKWSCVVSIESKK